MTATRHLLPILALLAPGLMFAQPGRSYSAPPSSLSFEAGIAPGGDVSDDAGHDYKDVDIIHYGAAFEHRIPLQGGSLLSLGFEYDRYDLDVDDRYVPLPEQAQSLGLSASLRHRVNDRWSVLGAVNPKFNNTDGLFDSDGFNVNVTALALYNSSETLTLAFGVIYRSMAEDDLRVLPAFGFDWHPNNAWRVSVGFPRSGVTYTVADNLKVSLGVSAAGGTYYIKDRLAIASSSVYPNLYDTVLDYTEVRVGLGLEYEVTENLELTANVGVIAFQEFDYYERNYELEGDSGTPFFSLGAKYSF